MDVCGDEPVEEVVEGRVVVDADAALAGVVVFVDVDLGEEGLVEQPPGVVVGLLVGGVAVAGEVERVGEQYASAFVVGVGGGEVVLDPVELVADPLLLGLEQVQRDGVGVVGVEQFLPLGGQVDALPFELLAFGGGGGLEVVEVVEDELFDGVAQAGGQRDGSIFVLEEFLDEVDGHGLSVAVGDLAGASGADEVAVLGAPLVAGGGDHQPGAAAAAVDAATQVVLVRALMGAGGVVGGEQCLHLLPGLRVDERFVGPGVDDAAVVDLALVVGVAQQLMQSDGGERFARPLRGGPGGQPAVGEVVDQGGEGALAFGVAVERPRDVVGPLGVDLDGPVDPAEVVGEVHILVAERRPGDGAAEAGFLHEAFGDLVGEVAGVELGDAGHDAVHQHPGGCLVDVLAGRHQRDPGLGEREVDGDVVGAGSGQPVELVHDAVVDWVVADVGQHPLQVGPFRGRGAGLAGVDELLHDDRTEGFCLAGVRLALRGDREAFVAATAGGLVGG